MDDRRFGYEEFGLGIMLGVALGAAVGLLMAPQSGAATRSQLATKATDLGESATELVDQAKHSLELAAGRVEGMLGLTDKNIRKKLDELRSDLEKLSLEKA